MFATMLLGVAVKEERAAFAEPAMNATCPLTLALPDTAVIVFISALVAANVVV